MPRYDYWETGAGADSLAQLQDHALFINNLIPDIHHGVVFPAIRGHKIDFYYLGQKLCTYDTNTFKANIAYLAAFQHRPNGEVTEEEFSQLTVCTSFSDGYDQIKDNIRLYKQPESGELSKLCRDHSCFKIPPSLPIVILDVELSLRAIDEGRSQDRIDLVLFHLNNQTIRFVEVKTFDNKEIWPNPNGHVEVADQIARYKQQSIQNCGDLMSSYCQYVHLLNVLFGITLPEPTAIDENVDLLVTGFDSKQRDTLRDELLPAFGEAFRTNYRGGLSKVSQRRLALWWN